MTLLGATSVGFEPLDGKRHDRAAFACGNEALDRYLKQQAAQDLSRRVAVTWVLADRGGKIAGYYSLSNASVVTEEFVGTGQPLPSYSRTPATLIGRLARDVKHRGQGVGEILLADALRRSLITSAAIGSHAVVVDAIDEAAAGFYARYGFIRFPDHPHRLFIPMAVVARLFV